jgi:Mycothiol maleylpyruvate isomerase N-terminal domain
VTVDRRPLLDEEARAWETFRVATDRVDPARMLEPTVTPDGWSARDTIHHVAAWLDLCGRVLEETRAGTWDPATAPEEQLGFVDVWNEEQAERARSMDPAEVTAFLHEARQRARSAFEALDDVDANAWSWFEESGAMHFAKHVHDLTAWTAGRPSDPAVGPLFQEETDAWLEFIGVMEQVPRDAYASAVVNDDGWTPTDVVYHVTAWLEHSLADIEANRGWGHDDDPNEDAIVDQMNAGFLARGREPRSVDALEDGLRRARARLREALASLTDPSEDAKAWFHANGAEHYGDHLDELRRAAQGR